MPRSLLVAWVCCTACNLPFETCGAGTAVACVGPDMTWDGGQCCVDIVTSCVAGSEAGCPGFWTGQECCFSAGMTCSGASPSINRKCPTNVDALCSESPAAGGGRLCRPTGRRAETSEEGCDGYWSPDAGCCEPVPYTPSDSDAEPGL
jgi:hypothetical protein